MAPAERERPASRVGPGTDRARVIARGHRRARAPYQKLSTRIPSPAEWLRVMPRPAPCGEGAPDAQQSPTSSGRSQSGRPGTTGAGSSPTWRRPSSMPAGPTRASGCATPSPSSRTAPSASTSLRDLRTTTSSSAKLPAPATRICSSANSQPRPGATRCFAGRRLRTRRGSPPSAAPMTPARARRWRSRRSAAASCSARRAGARRTTYASRCSSRPTGLTTPVARSPPCEPRQTEPARFRSTPRRPPMPPSCQSARATSATPRHTPAPRSNTAAAAPTTYATTIREDAALVTALAERGEFDEARERAGDLIEARARLALAEGDFETAHTYGCDAGARWVAALALAHLGRREEAVVLAETELAQADRFDAPVPVARALLARAVRCRARRPGTRADLPASAGAAERCDRHARIGAAGARARPHARAHGPARRGPRPAPAGTRGRRRGRGLAAGPARSS